MKRFSERNLVSLAVVGTLVLSAVVLGAVNFSKLPLINDHAGFNAAFADAAGLAPGDPVSISGVDVGTVSGLRLDGAHVVVAFTVRDGVRLGRNTSVSARVLTPLGQEYLAVAPSGTGSLPPGATIPLGRTSEPNTLVSTVDQFGRQAQKIDVSQLAQALDDTSQDLEAIPAGTASSMLSGLAQLSQVIGSRSGELSQLVGDVSQLSGTLAQHSSQLVSLLGQSDLVLQVLNERHQAITRLLATTASLSSQLNTLLSTHRSQLTPLLNDLQTISGVLSKDGGDLSDAIPLLAAANRYLANVSGSGSFGDFVLPTALIPDNVIAACTQPGKTKPATGCSG